MNVFNIFGSGRPAPQEPTESETLLSKREKSFNALSALITPQMIATVKSEFTADEAKSEGLTTIKRDRTEEFAQDFKQALAIVLNHSIRMNGTADIDKSALAQWLDRTAYRAGHELSDIVYGHGPAYNPDQNPTRSFQDLIKTSPEIASAFNELKSHYSYGGAQINFSRHSQNPDTLVNDELCSVFAKVIKERLVGDVTPLTFSEFQAVVKTHRALE